MTAWKSHLWVTQSFKMSLMGIPGNIGIPQTMGIIPGMTPFATAIMKSKMKKLDVPPVREYLQMLMDGGAKLYGCKMTCDLYNLTKDSFIDGVQGVLTASEFVEPHRRRSDYLYITSLIPYSRARPSGQRPERRVPLD